MKIELHQISVRELCASYQDLSIQEEGIIGYGGRLNIRPKYQREFVYDEKKRNAVMDTVWQGFPLNVMYWVKIDKSQKSKEKSLISLEEMKHTGLSTIEYELLDGQQRTISICSFIAGEYMMLFDGNLLGFNNMTEEQQNRILDYRLQVYICEGTDEEKLRWFQTINIAGEKLTDQEIRNAIYSGSWVTQAKRRFSKTGCVAYKIGSDFMNGSPIRQDYFETALRWIGDKQGVSIEQYMARHQHDTDADELWQYYQDVIHWTEKLFGRKYKKEMKGVQWGLLYNQYRDTTLTATAIGEEVARLMRDSDVQKKSGIFHYIFDHDIRHLGIRAFDDNTKREVYERQGGICPICGKHFEIEQMEADHITPWVEGGRTIAANCQMLCRECNRRKSAK
ncbi:MAG: DUF262 domain-containing protein [Paludibacteraceae bacterium]|nr:DUF262 domain-containing protein [Paludibacteraceae bacterium]